jgi:hypothetical protein
VDWVVYGALIAAVLVCAAGAALLTVRVLQAWRAFKRLRRRLARALAELADAADRTSQNAQRIGDQPQLERSLARLRKTLAVVDVLREALDEVRGVTALYPRK